MSSTLYIAAGDVVFSSENGQLVLINESDLTGTVGRREVTACPKLIQDIAEIVLTRPYEDIDIGEYGSEITAVEKFNLPQSIHSVFVHQLFDSAMQRLKTIQREQVDLPANEEVVTWRVQVDKVSALHYTILLEVETRSGVYNLPQFKMDLSQQAQLGQR